MSLAVKLLIILSFILHLALHLLSYFVPFNHVYMNVALHSTLEACGSVMALGVAYCLICEASSQNGTKHNYQIATAMIVMGILDFIHASLPPGNSFVWFHSISTFLGGLAFSTVWLRNLKNKGISFLKISLGFTIAISLCSLVFHEELPLMLNDQFEFSRIANYLNHCGAFLLLLASFGLYHSYRLDNSQDDLLFSCHTFLFGLSAAIFHTSLPWNLAWWIWHVLRFLAYLAAAVFILRSFRSNRALRQEKSLLSLALKISDLGVWSLDDSYNNFQFDSRMREIYDLPSVTQVSKGLVLSMFFKEDQAKAIKLIEELNADSSAVHFTHRILRRSGEVRYVRSSMVPTVGKSGKISGVLGVNKDVTEDVINDRTKQRLLEILDNTTDYVCHINTNGMIEYANDALVKALGLQANGQFLVSSIHTTEAWDVIQKQGLKVSRQIGSWSGSTAMLSFDGQEIPVSHVIVAHRDSKGSLTHYSSIMRDVREQNRLISMIEERSAQLESALKARSFFLANMSHEIRTPMNGVLGMVSLLTCEISHPRHRKILRAIESSGELLLSIVNDVLDLSKVEANQLKLEMIPVDLKTLIEDIVLLQEEKATTRCNLLLLDYDESLPDQILADPFRLKQVLLNLISNAIKFCYNGNIIITVRQKEHSVLSISVSDEGIGIPFDKQTQLFEPFTQADESTTRKFGGTGLGLSICKAIVSLWGGDISIESAPLIGTTISFSIPLQACRQPIVEERIDLLESKPLFTGRVLIAEDNSLNREIVIAMLEKLGFEVDIAVNGREAVDKTLCADYDFVFMDCQMPEMDGFEATRHIKSKVGSKKPLIIALTANAQQDDRDKCLDAGMDDFLSKPIGINKLRKVIENYSYGQLSRSFMP